jgi:2-polyprenyl-3-methyl-5-hydroxy-6-metoxy-1,4-benzoquinol methylase
MEGGSLYRCFSCYLSFRSPQISEQELKVLYVRGSKDTWARGSSSRREWKIALSWIEDTLPKGAAILDVGCSDGAFLNTLAPNYQLFGIELQSEAGDKARDKGITVLGSSYEELIDSAVHFDAVVAFDLIEHVRDPARFLSTLTAAAKPSGIVIISSGNSDAWTWRIMGASYWYCTLSEHISFINPRWCDRTAREIGLSVERTASFSHLEARACLKLAETTKNIIFRIAPRLLKWLRKRGFGNKNATRFESLALHPPSWMTARDHFVFLGRKSAVA